VVLGAGAVVAPPDVVAGVVDETTVVAGALVVAADVLEPASAEDVVAPLSVVAPELVVVSVQAVVSVAATDAIASTDNAARLRNLLMVLPLSSPTAPLRTKPLGRSLFSGEHVAWQSLHFSELISRLVRGCP
jgi:hypothetical protein